MALTTPVATDPGRVVSDALLDAVLTGNAAPATLSELDTGPRDAPALAGGVAYAATGLPPGVDAFAVWRGLCDALAHTGHPVATPVLTAVAESGSDEARRAATRALLGLGVEVRGEPVPPAPPVVSVPPAGHRPHAPRLLRFLRRR